MEKIVFEVNHKSSLKQIGKFLKKIEQTVDGNFTNVKYRSNRDNEANPILYPKYFFEGLDDFLKYGTLLIVKNEVQEQS